MKTETISSQDIYKGRIFDVRLVRIREDGKEYERAVVEHPGSAVIVPLFADGSVALVRQYRHPAGKELLEVPAGSLEHGEDPKEGAMRELEEEIGVRADQLDLISEFYVSPGFLTEKMHVYLATGLTETAQNLDEDENIEIVRMPLTEALELVRNGTIEDAKTMIGLTIAAARTQR